MPEGKSLKFKFELDEASFMRVKSALQQLTQEAQKFSKALQGGMAGGGGIQSNAQFGNLMGGGQLAGQNSGAQIQARSSAGGGATASLASVVQQNVSVFKNLAQTGTQAMKGLSNILKQSIQDQKQDLATLNQALDASVRRYERLHAAGSKAAAGAGKLAMSSAAAAEQAQERLQELEGAQAGLNPVKRGWAARAASSVAGWVHTPGANGGPDRFFGGSTQGLAPTTWGGLTRMGATVVGGVSATVNESMAGTRMHSSLEAERSGLVNPLVRQLRGGDPTMLQALRYMQPDGQRLADLKAQVGIEPAKLIQARSMGGKALRVLAGLTGVGGAVLAAEDLANAVASVPGSKLEAYKNAVISGGTKFINLTGGGSTSITAGATDTGVENAQAKNWVQQAEEYSRSTEFLDRKMSLEAYGQTFSSRVASGRISGLGVNFKHKLAGLKGFGDVDARTGGPDLSEGRDAWGRREADLMRQGGYSGAELDAATLQSRQAGLGGGYSNYIMKASAAGWGQWGGILGAAGAAGAKTGRTADMLAHAALGTSSNTAAGMQIAQSVFQYDPRGTTSGLATLAAMQGGAGVLGFTGGVGDMNAARRAEQGMAAGDRLAGGFDAFQQGRNLVSSMQVAPGLSTYGQDYLATGMNFKQLLAAGKGELTETASAQGVTSEMARSQLANMGTSVFERFVDQGGSDRMSVAIRGLRASGQGLPEYMKGLKGRGAEGIAEAKALGVFMGQEMGVGEEGGLGLAGLYTGMDLDTKGLKSRGVPIQKQGALEQANFERNAEAMMKEVKTREDNTVALVRDTLNTNTAADAVQKFGLNIGSSAQVFTEALLEMTKVIKYASHELSGGKAGSPNFKGAAPEDNSSQPE